MEKNGSQLSVHALTASFISWNNHNRSTTSNILLTKVKTKELLGNERVTTVMHGVSDSDWKHCNSNYECAQQAAHNREKRWQLRFFLLTHAITLAHNFGASATRVVAQTVTHTHSVYDMYQILCLYLLPTAWFLASFMACIALSDYSCLSTVANWNQ